MTGLTPPEQAALQQIAILEDAQKLRSLIDNARRLKSLVVERAAFARLCIVQPQSDVGSVEHDVWQSIHALEEMHRLSRGKTIRLTRTRQKIARDGEIQTVADLALKPDASQGFIDLIALGHPELTFEAVVIRHPAMFTETVQSAARLRLGASGINADDFINSPKGL